ncbi:hypothetical protein ACFFV7_29610 [Nonomuraea spiralis]|uniref:Uncharacterized protein n=1 Tax=Nonomuraea spiralis TaxID=46182 RepID=A0ABV5IN99_9ACTN|nr:hypothetical protein [Nonomuraea spiralis]GGT43636.1 hypothetical protein GCM10010176_104000 [Nonomuraea spiralis]
MNSTANEPFEELIERSSLGATGARQLRQRTPQLKLTRSGASKSNEPDDM